MNYYRSVKSSGYLGIKFEKRKTQIKRSLRLNLYSKTDHGNSSSAFFFVFERTLTLLGKVNEKDSASMNYK